MAYPNSSPYNVIISQTSGSSVGGQYPFVERIISGSNLFIVTDANGNLTGSTSIPGGSFTNLTVTGALTASIISASTALTSAAATFAGPVTMSATLSASSGITASAIYDSGALTVLGLATFQTLSAASITSSGGITGGSLTVTGTSALSTTNVTGLLSASAGITSSNIYDAGTLTVLGATTVQTLSAASVSSSGTVTGGSLTVTGTSALSTTNVTGLLSASAGVTASAIYDAGTLTVVGASTFGTVTATAITSALSGSSVSTGNATIAGGTINGTSIGASVASTGNFTSITANSISSSVITSSRLFGTADTASIANALNSANTYSVATLNASGTLTTNALSASGTISASSGYFAGNLYVGGTLSATISGSITQAATASTVTITDTPSTSGTYYITFVDGTTGARVVRTDSDGLSYNPSTNTLSSSGTVSSSNAWHNALVVTGTSTLGGLVSASAGLTSSAIYDSGVLTVAGVTSLTNTTNNPNFSTTNALYVAGGVTIAKDLYISGSTTIAGNLTILGTGSIVNISSSTIVIGTNRIELNAGVPIYRYAGIDVFDSGSGTFVNQVTSSFLWDGLNDNWLLVSANSSSGAPLTQSSTIIIGGPSGSFGNETKLTNNFLPKSQVTGKNIADSKVSDDGSTLLYTGTTISGSQITASGNLYVVGTGASGTGSITYATGVLVTYATGSFNTLTITTGSSPGVGSVPATPTSVGMPGQINVDNNFIYVYTNSSWKRVPLSQWAV